MPTHVDTQEQLLGEIYVTDSAEALIHRYQEDAQEIINKHLRLLSITVDRQVVTSCHLGDGFIFITTHIEPRTTEIILL